MVGFVCKFEKCTHGGSSDVSSSLGGPMIQITCTSWPRRGPFYHVLNFPEWGFESALSSSNLAQGEALTIWLFEGINVLGSSFRGSVTMALPVKRVRKKNLCGVIILKLFCSITFSDRIMQQQWSVDLYKKECVV